MRWSLLLIAAAAPLVAACVAPLLASRPPLGDSVMRVTVESGANGAELHIGPAGQRGTWAVLRAVR